HISRQIDLGELHNVNDVGVVDGQLLTWVASANEWRPMTLDSGGLGDNWGTQIAITDTSIFGDGTAGNPLSVNWDTLAIYPLNLGDLHDVNTDSLGPHFVLGWDYEDSTWKPHLDNDMDMSNELIDSVAWQPVDSSDTNFNTLRITEHSVNWDVVIPVNQDSLADNSVFELSDVDTNGVAEKKLMRWTFKETLFVGTDTLLRYSWQPVSAQQILSEHNVNELADVNDSVPDVGDVMQWDGTNWGPGMNVGDIVNVWEDHEGYIQPLTANTVPFRIYDMDSVYSMTLIDTSGTATGAWNGLRIDKRGVAASDGYGIYSYAGTNGGVVSGSEFYGVKGVAGGGDRVYGIYGDGDNPGPGGEGYGVYGRGNTYGLYGYGTGTNAYGVYGTGTKYGVYGSATGTGSYGVYGHSDEGYAGSFDGRVQIQDGGKPAGYHLLEVGDDAYFTDIDIQNTVALYGIDDSTKGILKLGADGPTLTGENGNLGIDADNPGAKLQINASGDYSWNEHDNNPFEIWDGNYTLYMGADSSNDISYIQSVGEGALKTLALNARGGSVTIGTHDAEGNTFRISGRENDGTYAAVKITSGGQNMLIDGNEIDVDGPLYLQSNSESDIFLDGVTYLKKDKEFRILLNPTTYVMPIVINRYHMTHNGSMYTGYSTSEWSAVVVGFDVHGDINETDRHEPLIKVLAEKESGQWKIDLDMAYDHDDPEWWVDVMFIRKEICDDTR
ncbi:MAG: hypothetical protein J7M03_02150, partial [Candidatus Desulfofervidaceae bacterium]|nr:hypothetical protein [Candidatus Desulfofervidaceae bacterium]